MGQVTVLRATAAKPARQVVSLKPTQVAARIREMILQDELAPGAPVRERTLAELLNVSRTPLREALKMLAAEGLVELQPRRGAVVTAPTSAEVRELLQLLGVIEAYAGELACESATDDEIREIRALHYEMLAAFTRADRLGYFHRNQDIHRAMVATTRNRTLIEHHRMLNARVYRLRYICNLRTERWESAIREHEKILAALERRDRQAIASVLKEHVVRAFDAMQRLFGETADTRPRPPEGG